jgi:hypothetical protein
MNVNAEIEGSHTSNNEKYCLENWISSKCQTGSPVGHVKPLGELLLFYLKGGALSFGAPKEAKDFQI